MLRYRDEGNLHLDFHRTTNGTIGFLRRTYGREVLDETFRRTARDVYRSIHEDLMAGDWDQLLEHWSYFFDREGGDYTMEQSEDEIRLTVHSCPAIAYLKSRGTEVDPDFCRQTEVMNATWAAGSPFSITTEVLGDGRCVQTIRRNKP
jgi:predicted ArsR family transcriptional regulator